MLPVQGMIDSAATHVGSGDAKDPMISAVYGDYTGVPPLFLLGGTRELIGSEAWRTAARAREHGCEVTLVTNDGMWHMAIADGSGVPEEQYAFDQMMRFFNKNLIKG